MEYEQRPKKMVELPQYTQDFLIGLKRDEVEELQEAMELVRSIRTVSKFLKWVIITSIAIFLSFVSLGEGFFKLRAWFK